MDEGSSCIANVGVSCLSALVKAMLPAWLPGPQHAQSSCTAVKQGGGGVSAVLI